MEDNYEILLTALNDLEACVNDTLLSFGNLDELQIWSNDVANTIVTEMTLFNESINARAQEATELLGNVVLLCDNTKECMEAVSSATQTVNSEIKTFTDNILTRIDELSGLESDAKETADSAIALLEEEVGEIEDQVDEMIENAQEQVEELLETMISEISDSLLDPVEEFREECVEKLNALIEKVVDDILPGKMDEVTQEWLNELRDQLTEMINKIQEGLGEFRESILDGTDNANGSRVSSELALDLLRTSFAPVTGALDRVSALAGTVGISI